MPTRSLGVCLILLAVCLSGCGGSSQDISEIKEGQRKIMAKLDDIEKRLAQGPSRPVLPPIDPNRVVELPLAESPIRGAADGPIVITEFSDFQCPFCAKIPALMEDLWRAYPKQLKLVFKNFPLPMHKDAMAAARAGAAAQRQGKFWEMHDQMFGNQRTLDAESLKNMAREIGLDLTKFESDMASKAVQSQIDEDMRLGQAIQVNGTPSLFINGKRVNDRSVEALKKMIDEILKAKS